MKKKLMLIPVALMAMTACGGTAASSNAEEKVSDNASLIENMRLKTYRVSFNGTQTETYPEGYEAYNNTSDVSVTREYGYIDGNKDNLRAARVITDSAYSTYYEAEDGRMYTQVIKSNNEVERSYLSYLGTYYRFGSYYSSPFDYIGEDDIDENMNLSANKAYLLFNYYTGVEQPVSEAKFTLNDEGLISKVDFTFQTLPVGITTETDVETINVDMTGSLTFDYDISDISYMSPYAEKSSKYESVVNGLGTNYTITSDSNATTSKFVTYVVGDTILFHLDATSNSAIANDMLYVKRGSSYKSYIYTGKEWTRDESVQITDILPDLSGLSANLIEDKSDNHLALKEDAAAYCANNFMIPYMAMTDGTGLKADMYLKNDKIDYVTAAFAYYSGNVIIKNTYSNYGTTEMPIWFEMPEA